MQEKALEITRCKKFIVRACDVGAMRELHHTDKSRVSSSTCLRRLITMIYHDSLAERSKAVAQGAIPQGRGFEPHSCHYWHLFIRQHKFQELKSNCNFCWKLVIQCSFEYLLCLRGTWCSGITSASHAEGPGFNPQCVHL